MAATAAATPAQGENLESNEDSSPRYSPAGQTCVLMQIYQRFCIDRRVFSDLEPVHHGADRSPANMHLACLFQLLPQLPRGRRKHLTDAHREPVLVDPSLRRLESVLGDLDSRHALLQSDEDVVRLACSAPALNFLLQVKGRRKCSRIWSLPVCCKPWCRCCR